MSIEGWIKIFRSREEYQAIIIKDLLEKSELHPVLINHRDSEFFIGETEVYVAPEEFEKARKVIQDNQASV
jgi:hypothetical protein